MTENNNLVRSLHRRLADLGEVSILDNTKVSEITLGKSSTPSGPNLSLWPHLKLSNSRTIAARLLVGADGPNSPVRTFADIPSRGWDYNRHGVVATLKLDSAPEHPATAYQRFLPTGPIALLPLPGPYATLVWSTTPEKATILKSLAPADFVTMVNAAFRLTPTDIAYLHTLSTNHADELSWRIKHTPIPSNIPILATAVQDNSVASFPLRLRHADTYATHRIALVGDAAHTTHPLAGQGLNMGIGDVASLARTIGFAVEHGMDIGDQLSLEAYNSERYEPNHRLLGVVDKLHKLYSTDAGPVVALRSWGLEAVDRMQGVKSFLMRMASG